MPGRTKWMKTLGELCSRSSLKLLFYNCGTQSASEKGANSGYSGSVMVW